MQLNEIPSTVFKAEPPPLWYVTNGEVTVGPVITSRLVRGVEYGRIPEDCHVRTFRGTWRTLNSVRELSTFGSNAFNGQTQLQTAGQELAEWLVPLERVKDEMEFCHTAAWLSLLATGAESAMLHFRSRSLQRLSTRAVIGSVSTERLGHALPENDLVLKVARLGIPVLSSGPGPTQQALATRFTSSTAGVGSTAMVPTFFRGQLTAMLELSRPGHAFRRTDLQRAERIVHRILRQRMN